jgi:hypothetical protein
LKRRSSLIESWSRYAPCSKSLAIGLFVLSLRSAVAQSDLGPVEYVSPLPGARLVSLQSSIILRMKNPVNNELIADASQIVVSGSASGRHAGVPILSDDGRTMVFEPSSSYAPGETVTVELRWRSLGNGAPAQSLRYQFTTSSLSSARQREFIDRWKRSDGIPGPNESVKKVQ